MKRERRQIAAYQTAWISSVNDLQTAPIQSQNKPGRILRAVNIILCVIGIIYFGSGLKLFDFSTSFLDVVSLFFAQVLIVFPQIVLLLVMLAVEMRRTAGMVGHAVSFAVIVALLLLGYVWSTGVIAAIES
jgi:hypothetical protein